MCGAISRSATSRASVATSRCCGVGSNSPDEADVVTLLTCRHPRAGPGARNDRAARRGIFVEAAAGFASQPTRIDVLAQERTRTILRILEAVVEHLENREQRIEADEIGEFERSHRMVHAQLHHRVDRFARADPSIRDKDTL